MRLIPRSAVSLSLPRGRSRMWKLVMSPLPHGVVGTSTKVPARAVPRPRKRARRRAVGILGSTPFVYIHTMVTQVRDRSLGLFPGFPGRSQTLIMLYMIRVGKGSKRRKAKKQKTERTQTRGPRRVACESFTHINNVAKACSPSAGPAWPP